jgi:hypothetical protein
VHYGGQTRDILTTFPGVSLSGSPLKGDIPLLQGSLSSPLFKMEVKCYYAGLSSAPALVARTSTTPWEVLVGLEAYWRVKELRPIGNHALKRAWEDNLALKLQALLDSMNVK